jgi:hypothetical protein
MKKAFSNCYLFLLIFISLISGNCKRTNPISPLPLNGTWQVYSLHDEKGNYEDTISPSHFCAPHYLTIKGDTVFYYGIPECLLVAEIPQISKFSIYPLNGISFQKGPNLNATITGNLLDSRYSAFFTKVETYKRTANSLYLFQSNTAYFMRFGK